MMAKRTIDAALLSVFLICGSSANSKNAPGCQDFRPPAETGKVESIQFKSIDCYCLFPSNQPNPPAVEITIHGRGFGRSRGTRMLVIDGQPALDPKYYISWTDMAIGFYFDYFEHWVQWIDHDYQFAIGDTRHILDKAGPVPYHKPSKNTGLTIISPEFRWHFPIQWNYSTKQLSGKPDSTIQILLCGIGTAQGNQVLMIGSTPVTNIVTWGKPEGNITFKVPAMPAGGYTIYIKRGGNVISAVKPFTVL